MPDHQRGIDAAKKAFYRNMDPGLGVEEAISAYLATTEPGKPESGVLAEAVKVKPSQSIRDRAIEIICREAEELGYCEDDVAVLRRGEYDGDDLLTLRSVESALTTPPQPEAQGDEAEALLDEIADGAWGDDPRIRGIARDRIAALRDATAPESK
jgi:hypothetical protein